MTKFATNDDCLANSGGDTCDEYTNWAGLQDREQISFTLYVN
jgi:hypothetical protein